MRDSTFTKSQKYGKAGILMTLFFLSLTLPSLLKAQSAFTPGNLVVEQVGFGGSTTLSSAASPINFVEFSPTTGAVAQSVSANTSVFSESGSAGTAGCLTLSADGTTLVFVGYNEAIGAASVTSSTVNREVGFLTQGSSPTPKVATYFTNSGASSDGYTANNIKAAYFDGSYIWVSGNDAATSSGVHISTVTSGGAASPNTLLTSSGSAFTVTCGIGVFKDQLYVTQSGGSGGTFQMGTGKPTTSGQTATAVGGTYAVLSAVYLNVTNANPGHPDVMYTADDGKTGLLHKYYWSTSSSAWALAGTAVISSTTAAGAGGYIAADMNSTGGIDIYVVIGEGNKTANSIIKCTDVGALTAVSLSGTPTTILSAGTNYEFTGISWAPSQTSAISASNYATTISSSGNLAGGNYGDLTIPSGVTATLTGNIYINGTLNVLNGGTLNCGNYFVFSPKGSYGTFYLQSGGTLITADDSGITNFTPLGSIQTFSRFYSPGAHYIYNGSVAQFTGTGLPSTVLDLTVNNSNGLTLTNPLSVTDSLTLTSGTLSIGNNKLTINSSTGTIIGAGTSNYIATTGTGAVEMTLGTSGLSFPLGVTDYNPVKIATTSGTATIDASVSNTITNPVNVALTNHAVNRTWSITPQSSTTIDITPQWDNSKDLAGSTFLNQYISVVSRSSINNNPWLKSQSVTSATNVSGTLYDLTSGNIAMTGSTSYLIGVIDSTSGYNAQYKSGNLIVERVGTGTATLTSSGSAIELIQVSTTGTKIDSFTINNSGNTPGTRMVESGSATSEGKLTLSGDGRHLLLVGYDTAAGVASIASEATGNGPNRMVGMVDVNENVTMPTWFPNTASAAFYKGAMRCAASDGVGIWATGVNGATNKGDTSAVRYTSVLNGTSSGAGSLLTANTVTNTRCINVFKDQVYYSTASGGTGVYKLGTGKPTGAATPTLITPAVVGSAGAGGSPDPYDFVMLDVDTTIAGPELMYVTSLSTTPYGIYKFANIAGTWTNEGYYPVNPAGVASIVAAMNTSGTIDIYAICAGFASTGNDSIVKFTDGAAFNATINVTSAVTIARSGSDYVYRGITWAPTQTNAISNYSYTPANGTTIAAGNYNDITIANGVIATLGGNITLNGTLTVMNGGTLICGSYIISSPQGSYGTFDLNNGGTIQIGSPNGITRFAASGNIQTFSRFYRKGAHYIYNGSSAQVTGNGFPSTALDLTINNSSGLTLSAPASITDSLTFTSGTLTLGANKLTINGTTGTIIGATASNYVVTNGTGVLEMNAGTGGVNFPVGLTDYNPLKVKTTSSTATFDVFVTNTLTNSNNIAGTDHSVNRKWNITSSSSTTSIITPQWDDSKDLTGSHFVDAYSFIASRTNAYATWIPSQAAASDNKISGTLYNLSSGNIVMASGTQYQLGVFDTASTYNAVDAGVYNIQAPNTSACAGLQPIKVLLRNYGNQNLTSASIGWTINRVTQTPYSWTGTIASAGKAVVTVGNYTFSVGKDTIKAWTYAPNGQVDSVALNDTAKSNIVVNALPAAAVASPSTVCSGTSVSIGASPVSGSTYSWVSSAGGYSSTLSNPSVSPTSNTTYTVTETNSNGCSNSNSVTITTKPLPAAAAGSPSTICVGVPAFTIGAASVSGSTYSWSSSTGGFSSTVSNPSVSPTTTTTYTVTETGSNGCSDSNSVKITVNALPTASVISSTAICAGSFISIGAGAVSGSSYAWVSTISGYSSTVSNPSVSPSSTATYTLTETNSNGCKKSNSVTITVNALPAAAAGSPSTICAGVPAFTIGAAAVSGSTYSWTSTISGFSSTVSNPSVSPATTATYTVTEINSSGCSNSNSVTITVNPLPAASVISNTAICAGTSISIGAAAVTGSSYAWSSTISGYSSTASNPSVSPASTATYTLTETNSNNCVNSNSVTITVNALPAAAVSSPLTICAGTTVSIGATKVTGSTYSWASTISGFSSTVSNPSVSPSTTATYTITEINSNGCSKSNTITITVNPVPSAAVASNQAVCPGTPVSIGATSVSGDTYSWISSLGGYSSTSSNPTITPDTTATYTLTETITATGCKKSDTVRIYVNPAPSAYTGPNSTICVGNSLKIGGTAVTGNSYSWTGTGGFTSTVSNPTVSPSSTSTYTLTESVSGSCTTTKSVKITVNPVPVANAGSSSSICASTSGSIGATAVSGDSYSWTSLPAGYSSTVSSASVNPSGTTTYILTESNPVTGCSNTNSVVVTVNPLPSANAGTNASICSGFSIKIGSTAISGNTYSWVSSPSGLNSTSSNPSVSPTSTTSYTITEKVTSTGCSNSNSITVTVNSLPGAATGSASTICSGSSTAIGASAVLGDTYSWTSIPSGYSSTSSSPSVNPTANTTYVLVESITATGCTKSNSVLVTVNALPAANAGTNATTCAGQSATIGAAAVSGSTYLWSSNPSGFNSTTANNTVNPSSTTVYTVNETNAAGCVSSNSVTVKVNALPGANISASSSAVCAGNSASLTLSGPVSGNTYQWFLNGNAISGATNSGYSAFGGGTYYELVTNSNGCSAKSNLLTIKVNQLPTAIVKLSGITAFCQGDSLVMVATLDSNDSYQWSNLTSSPSLITGATGYKYAASASGTYQVKITSLAGCSDTSTSVRVTVNPLPTPSISATGATTFCNGGSVQLSSTATSGVNYEWYNNKASISGSTTNSYTATSSGSYSLQMVNTATGCSNMSSAIAVTVNSLPIANVTALGNTSFCQGGSVILVTDYDPSYTYKWSNTSGTLAGATKDTITAKQSGNYSVTATNGNGCSATSTALTVTAAALPSIKITRPASASVCQGAKLTISSIGTGVTTYQWMLNGNIINGANTDSIKPTQTGKYEVVATNAGGCTANDTIGITINATPFAAFITAANTICAGSAVAFANQSYISSGSALSYNWTFGDGGSSNVSSVNHTYSTAGAYSVQLSVTSPYGCSSVAKGGITVLIVNSSKFNTTGIGFSRVIFDAIDNTGSTYNWDFGDSTTGSGKAEYHQYAKSGTYTVTLTVTNANGCSSTTTSTVNVNASAIDPVTSENVKIQVFPNPFATQTNVIYNLTESASVAIEVIDIAGKRVAFVENTRQIAGQHNYIFNGSKPGTYFIKMTINNKLYVNKVVQQ